MKENLIFWLWCRWFGHDMFGYEQTSLSKEGSTNLEFRYCLGCDRIFEEDAERVLDRLSEEELDKKK